MTDSDPILDFKQVRERVLEYRRSLEDRVRQIDEVLAEGFPGASSPSTLGSENGARRRPKNRMSLKEAVVQVTTERALTKREILKAIHELGYRFSSPYPVNSLNAVLYSKGQFMKKDGKFQPA